jgi:hypothetical protein
MNEHELMIKLLLLNTVSFLARSSANTRDLFSVIIMQLSFKHLQYEGYFRLSPEGY